MKKTASKEIQAGDFEEYKKKVTKGLIKIRGALGNLLPSSRPIDLEEDVDDLCTQIANLLKTSDLEDFNPDTTKSDFLSLVSHQLRTPLTVSLLNMEMLLAGYKGELTAEQREAAAESYAAQKRMTEMLNVFSIVSKIELNSFILKPKSLDLKNLLDQIIKEQSERISQKKIDVHKDYDEDLTMIQIDPDFIRIALNNLIFYMVKNTPDNQQVQITAKGEEVGVFINIKNGGYVIPDEEKAKVFSKLYRSPHDNNKEDLGDTGLGLYLAKKIIDRCGGKVWLESEPAEGTTFFIFLPSKN